LKGIGMMMTHEANFAFSCTAERTMIKPKRSETKSKNFPFTTHVCTAAAGDLLVCHQEFSDDGQDKITLTAVSVFGFLTHIKNSPRICAPPETYWWATKRSPTADRIYTAGSLHLQITLLIPSKEFTTKVCAVGDLLVEHQEVSDGAEEHS
jgi:hypothetical protein